MKVKTVTPIYNERTVLVTFLFTKLQYIKIYNENVD